MTLWSRDGALERARASALWVLDVDGVLLDPRPSFYTAAIETASWAATAALGFSPPPITDAEIAAFKAAGGWNDDFELAAGCAWGLVLREAGRSRLSVTETAARSAGGLAVLLSWLEAELAPELLATARVACGTRRVRDRAAARYSGLARCKSMYEVDPADHPDLPHDGLWTFEAILCDARRLASAGRALAFLTGRNGPEAELALARLEIDVPEERRWVDDGIRRRKPAPDGLAGLSQFADGAPMLFVGDSIDDQNAALAYRVAHPSSPEVVFTRIVEVDHFDAARAAGADVITTGLDVLLDALEKG